MAYATLTNLSPLPRQHWGVVTFPEAVVAPGVEKTLALADGRRFRMVRGATHGQRTVFRVYADLAGGEEVTGVVLDEPSGAAGPFQLHPWTSDDIAALMPALGVRTQTGLVTHDYWTTSVQELTLVESSPAHQRWKLVRRIPEAGVTFTWWADLLHADPVLHVYGSVVWSDRTDPAPARQFSFLALRAGEVCVFDFAARQGISAPLYDAVSRTWTRVLNLNPLTFQDGAGIALTGVMLSTPAAGAPQPTNPGDLETSRANLLAAEGGPVLGVCHEWDGDWLAGRHIPASPETREQHDAEWAAFQALQATFGGWSADRGIGSAANPAQTGDQEDFGATKGTAAVVAPSDPRAIMRLRYAMQGDMLRGLHLCDAAGLPLRAADHPQWVTWSQSTHWHPGVSPDRLGKVASPVPVGTGWNGYDDQHRSHNNLAAYVALSDDPVAEALVAAMGQIDLAAYAVRYPSWFDSARAQGRTPQALAQLLAVVSPATGAPLRESLIVRLAAITGHETLRVPGPMKVLAWGEPDIRKDVFRPDGTRGPWVSLWEHALALVGLKATANVCADPALEQTLRIVAETLATFGAFQHEGVWWTVGDILWSGGDAPAEGLSPTSRAVVAAADIEDVRSWVFAGMLAAREILGPTHALRAKLDEYVHAMGGDRPPRDRRQAEWWATAAPVSI